MNCDQYNDIIDLPHHVSATRPRMSMIDRAAQFSPFCGSHRLRCRHQGDRPLDR